MLHTMNIIPLDTSEKFVRTAVSWITGTILKAQHGGRTATIGLCGGSTPKPVYTLLSTERDIDWSRVVLFLLDERYVPVTHPENNLRMIKGTVLTRSAVVAEMIAPDTSLPLTECIVDYDQKIAKLSHIDLVIIGMGDDGHIASLFPPVGPEAYGPTKVIHTITDAFAVHDRISVTFPVLLHASSRLFLITGEKKSALLGKMQKENEDVSMYPAQYLFDNRTTWMVGP